MAGEVWPDVEGAVKAYLVADADVVASPCAGRGYFAIPDNPTFPLITVIRIAGGESESEAPVDFVLMQIDVRGRVRRLSECTQVLNAVRKSLSKLRGRTTIAGKADLFGALVQDVRRMPEPLQQDGDGAMGERPRYILTVQFTAVAPSS